MLFETVFIDHPVNRLQEYIEHFISELQSIDDNIKKFDIDLCDEEFRPRISAAPKLKKHLSDFFKVFIALGDVDREIVCNAFCCCNNIQNQVEGTEQCFTITDLPEGIREITKKLFKYMYENTLNSVGDIKDHYKKFYEEIPLKVCPFCGIEEMLHYDHFKQDYDHYLCKKEYPLAAVNMKNLFPASIKCNRIFKKAKDILHKNDGTRRKAFYPFQLNGNSIDVRLNGSELPSGNDKKGKWQISFVPAIEEVDTWDDVFNIRSRYRKDVYENKYNTWLMRFINIARKFNDGNTPWTENSVKIAIDKYIKTLDQDDINQYDDKIFLKKSLFRFICDEADSTNLKAIAKMINT